MPLYDYKCEGCDHVFSQIKSINSRHEPQEEECPECKEKKVKMQIGAACIMDSVRVFGLKPSGQHKDRMEQIKYNLKRDRRSKLK
jgi:putative FmdB family regulatory protein